MEDRNGAVGHKNTQPDDLQIVRLNITMPKKLRATAIKRQHELCIPNFSAYLQHLIRENCGFTESRQ